MSPLRRLALLPRDLAGALVWGPGPVLMARAPLPTWSGLASAVKLICPAIHLPSASKKVGIGP